MFKYLVIPVFTLFMMACQSNGDEPMSQQQSPSEQTPADQQAQPEFSPQQQQAAIDVSDAELELFIEVSSSVQEVQMESQTEMMQIVEEEGMEVDTYNQIAQARFNGVNDDELSVDDEQLEMFESASEKIAEIERDVEAQLTEAIENAGMERERFMEINMSLQQDPELQQRVQQKMMDSQTNRRQQPDSQQF